MLCLKWARILNYAYPQEVNNAASSIKVLKTREWTYISSCFWLSWASRASHFVYLVRSSISQLFVAGRRRPGQNCLHLGYTVLSCGALGSTYHVILDSPLKKGRKMAEVTAPILLLVFISVISQVCTDSHRILTIVWTLDFYFQGSKMFYSFR